MPPARHTKTRRVRLPLPQRLRDRASARVRGWWRRPSGYAVLSFLVVAGCCLFVFWQLHPALIFTNTTTAGGDTGAHVWTPNYLRDHLLTHGRITGWSPDWYDGFPALVFYFPLPSLMVVALGTILPYTIAFKIVTVLGVVFMPLCVWAWARLSDFKRPIPELMATLTVPFLFDRYFTIWGGNIASTLAGEFSFAISLSVGFLFLGVFTYGLRTGKHRALAAVLFAITALCHLIPTIFVAIAAIVILLTRQRERALILSAVAAAACGLLATAGVTPALCLALAVLAVIGIICFFELHRVLYAVLSAGAGLLLIMFWGLPFAGNLAYSTNMGWERSQNYLDNLFPFTAGKSDSLHTGTAHLPWIFGLAAIAVVVGLWNQRRDILTVASMAAAMALAFRLAPVSAIWNARFLPFWYLLVYLVAAFGAAELIKGAGFLLSSLVGEEVTAATTAAPLIGMFAFVGILVVPHLQIQTYFTNRYKSGPLHALARDFIPQWQQDQNFVTGWAEWNYKGYDYIEKSTGTYSKSRGQEYHDLVAKMTDIGKTVGCGRAMWEYESEEDQMGTPMALMLLPHWTDGCIGSQEGLFFESSSSTPWHFINQSELSKSPSRAMRDLQYPDLNVDQGIEHLQLMGVRYYMAISPEAQAQADANFDLKMIAEVGPYTINYNGTDEQRTWKIYEVADSQTVTGLAYEPVVMKGIQDKQDSFLKASEDWYLDPTRWDVPLATSGPKEWARVQGSDPAPPRKDVREAKVSNIEMTDNGISFDVDQPGTPVLVKTSYFPSWKPSGAKGPYRVTPNLMVVIPTSTHVSMTYSNTVYDYAGWLLTLFGLVAVVALWRLGPMKYPAEDEAEGEVSESEPTPGMNWPYAYATTATPRDRYGSIAVRGDGDEDGGPPGEPFPDFGGPFDPGDPDAEPLRTMEHQLTAALDEGRFSDGIDPDLHGYFDDVPEAAGPATETTTETGATSEADADDDAEEIDEVEGHLTD